MVQLSGELLGATPFAKPPGKGLSSPQLNVIWANNSMAMVLFAAGAITMSFRLSVALAHKHRD